MAVKEKGKYNRLKEFEGSKYSGMKVGARHKWYYDQGEWRERKVSPEAWDIYYQTTKRRAGKAPEGSGAPVGTGYNWLIIAHQRVEKLDANSYTTKLDGKKFKVAHKRASKDKWNITEKTQRKKVIAFLESIIEDLKSEEEVPYTTSEEKKYLGLEHQTKTELYQMAVEQQIPNRSKMSHEELLEAIKQNLDERQNKEQAEKTSEIPQLKNKTREELYQLAQEKSIRGRSEMKKEELVKVLRKRSAKKKTVA